MRSKRRNKIHTGVFFFHPMSGSDRPYTSTSKLCRVLVTSLRAYRLHMTLCFSIFMHFYWQIMMTLTHGITRGVLVSVTDSSAAVLTHSGRLTHICVGNLTVSGSNSGLSPGRQQAIIWTNAGILLIGQLGTNVSDILIQILIFSFKKMRLKCRLRNGDHIISVAMCWHERDTETGAKLTHMTQKWHI